MPDSAAYDWIAFDADDTLWHNEPLYQATQENFRKMLLPFHSAEWIDERLLATEMRNLQHFGYGIKAFTLSMIETAIELTEGRIAASEIGRIVDWGQEMLRTPVELLEGVEETIRALARDWRLMLLTKGDLLDQERKLAGSGLGDYFQALEVVAEKSVPTYRSLLKRHGVAPERFLMVGNSLRSDILPLVEMGAVAIHVPYAVTWSHEQVAEADLVGKKFYQIERISDLIPWLAGG